MNTIYNFEAPKHPYKFSQVRVATNCGVPYMNNDMWHKKLI